MTSRLVALMSVVLLLCLAAFGLLVSYYQDQVMAEVARTASEVGRATLRTFDYHSQATFAGGGDGNVFFWQSGETPPSDPHAASSSAVVMVELSAEAAAENPERRRRVIQRRELGGDGDQATVIVSCEGTGPELREEDCVTSTDGALDDGLRAQYFVRLEDITAEPDPARGLVLKIPRFTPEQVGPAETPHSVRDEPLRANMDLLQFPIPLDEYGELFNTMRRRSIFLFLGVFLVGTVLTAGVASRFTRPIRRLDAALHRLSDGDLDVAVDVQGGDEVARLGHAFNDMTGKLRAHRRRAGEMARREKLSALGRLAAGVAHDVRNPLHSIGLTLQHMDETGRPLEASRAGEFDRSLQLIRGEIRRLDRLVSNFLRFANGERGERHDVDLRGLLEQTTELIRKEAEWRNVEVVLEIGPDVPRIHADGESIRSSLLNLVLNSFEAMPDGGRLELQLGRRGDHALLRVSDTGCGIDPAERERVFEFGYTTREGGNGLGLAMVHQTVVEDHGGRVELESRDGAGTVVSVLLPQAAGESA